MFFMALSCIASIDCSLLSLSRLVQHLEKISAESAKVLIFVGTKRVADDLTKYLRQDGWPALAIHGDKQQQERDWVLNEFKTGNSPIMIATDVASRGLGTEHLSLLSSLSPSPSSLSSVVGPPRHLQRWRSWWDAAGSRPNHDAVLPPAFTRWSGDAAHRSVCLPFNKGDVTRAWWQAEHLLQPFLLGRVASVYRSHSPLSLVFSWRRCRLSRLEHLSLPDTWTGRDCTPCGLRFSMKAFQPSDSSSGGHILFFLLLFVMQIPRKISGCKDTCFEACSLSIVFADILKGIVQSQGTCAVIGRAREKATSARLRIWSSVICRSY